MIPFIYLATAAMILINLLIREIAADWLGGVLAVLLMALGLAAVLMSYVMIFFRYHKSLYSSEGYLTNTLPVQAHQLLLSKILVAFVWLLLSYLLLLCVVITVALMVAGESQGNLNLLQIFDGSLPGPVCGVRRFFWRPACSRVT
jgi:hypothetical protein